jgi:Predicted membrane protein (DUF2232)
MSEPVTTAPSERGWGKLLLALLAFLIIPAYTPLRALLPVEDTLLLVAPALAACCLVGWWAGGRLLLAAVWVAVAAWILVQPAPAPASAFFNLERGWSLLLAGSFGLVCLFGTGRPFFSRALGAAAMALTLVLLMSSRGPLTPARAQVAVQAEFDRRNAESLAGFRIALKQYPEVAKSMPQLASLPNELEGQLRTLADTGTDLFPSLLLLESLIALALAWGTYHRISRTRLGAPLGFLKDFRFNDQFVWGLIAGLTIVFIPSLHSLGSAGRNLLVFFGALYAIRGFGVLSWFLAPGALAATLLAGFAMLWWPLLNEVAVLGFVLLALAALGLGLGDTWADWRSRARPTT